MDNKLIEKIQKLISLADSPNENEAKSAMAKAQELMLKHNIDMRSVQDHDSEYGAETSDTFKREPANSKYINSILQGFFFVEIVKSKRREGSYFNYIGEKKNIDTAMHMRNFLTATFDRLWKEYKKENNASNSSKGSFIYGVYQGFRNKLEEQRAAAENQYGLVLVQDPKATEKMNEMFSRLSHRKSSATTIRDGAAMNAGKEKGRNINASSGAIA